MNLVIFISRSICGAWECSHTSSWLVNLHSRPRPTTRLTSWSPRWTSSTQPTSAPRPRTSSPDSWGRFPVRGCHWKRWWTTPGSKTTFRSEWVETQRRLRLILYFRRIILWTWLCDFGKRDWTGNKTSYELMISYLRLYFFNCIFWGITIVAMYIILPGFQ